MEKQEKKSFNYDLATYVLKLAEKTGNDLKCAEVYFSKNKYTKIEIEENSVKHSEIGADNGISIRAINKKGSLGFAFTNITTKKAIGSMVKNAVKMMNSGTEDPDFKDLPHPKQYTDVKGLFDDNIKNLTIEDTLKYVEDLIKICAEDELAVSQSAGFSSSYLKTYIVNSNGLEITGKDTTCSISSNIIVKDKVSKEPSSGYDYQVERSLKGVNPVLIAQNALIDAKKNLNRIKIPSAKLPLILAPQGTISLILGPIGSAINAEAFQYKRSFLVGKKDQIIGSEYLTVEDNALIDGAPGSGFFEAQASAPP